MVSMLNFLRLGVFMLCISGAVCEGGTCSCVLDPHAISDTCMLECNHCVHNENQHFVPVCTGPGNKKSCGCYCKDKLKLDEAQGRIASKSFLENALCEHCKESELLALGAPSSQEVPPGGYELVVMISAEAIPLIDDQELNLLVAKGFGSGGTTVSFNTAWIVEPYASLVTASYTYSWTPVNKAQLRDRVTHGQTTKSTMTPLSNGFEAQQTVTFDGTKWSEPTTDQDLKPSEISVNYDFTGNPLHPVLYAPYTKDGKETWVPYFYGEAAISGDALVGVPQISLKIAMMASVSSSTFLGEITASSLSVNYGDTTSQTVCVLVPPGKEVVKIVSGSCPS